MIPKKPAPHVMRGGNRFSEKIMRQQKPRLARHQAHRRRKQEFTGNDGSARRDSPMAAGSFPQKS
jgi:hypothetical protein